MEKLRKPFQGVWNIIRFNWHFYVISLSILIGMFLMKDVWNETILIAIYGLWFSILGTIIISLLVSYYVYDLSGFYKLSWIEDYRIENPKVLNVNAGFDETSVLIKEKYKNSELTVFDFYDPKKHTEVSIRRARKAYPPYPNTHVVTTNSLPLADDSHDLVFIIFSAHEIRNEKERIHFFKELQRVLKPSGRIIVTEHLRDSANFVAYSIGFFHFYSKSSWMKTFTSGKLRLQKEIKITPFTTAFVLEKNGIAS